MLYPKTYATVIEVIPRVHPPPPPLLAPVLGTDRTPAPWAILVLTDEAKPRELLLRLGWRSGYGHTGCRGFDFDVGTVVKVFHRPQDPHPSFRRRGS